VDFVGNIRVLIGEERGTLLKDGDAASKSEMGLREFQPNITAADHHQVARQNIQLECLDICERATFAQSRYRRNGRMRAKVEKDPFSGQCARRPAVV
jgi:hypothetical protein